MRWLRDFSIDISVKQIPGNIELRRPHFRERQVETSTGVFGHTLRIVEMCLVLGEFFKHWQLIRFLEPTKADSHRPGLGRHNDDRRMGPERRRNACHAIADSRSVLSGTNALSAADPGKSVGHVCSALFVHDRNEANPARFEDVHGIHKRGAHDAEYIGHTMSCHRFDEGFTGGHAWHLVFLLLLAFLQVCRINGDLAETVVYRFPWAFAGSDPRADAPTPSPWSSRAHRDRH